MKKEDISILAPNLWPQKLFEIPDPPKRLYFSGNNLFRQKAATELSKPSPLFVCIVGSRTYSPYGKDVCETLIADLRGLDIVIISGLALGIDAIVHEESLRNNIPTLALPGSGLMDSVLYPARNARLAEKITQSGGMIMSEFEPDFPAAPWTFPRRNRLMAALSDAIIVIEAACESGTLITAKLGLEYNKSIGAVPGSIFSKTSQGTNNLLKQGAWPITSAADVIELLGLPAQEDKGRAKHTRSTKDFSEDELAIIALLDSPIDKATFIQSALQTTKKPINEIQVLLMSLELKEAIKEELGVVRLRIKIENSLQK